MKKKSLIFLFWCFFHHTAVASTDLLTAWQMAQGYDATLKAQQEAYKANESRIRQSWSDMLPSARITANTADNRQKILFPPSGGPDIAHFNSRGYELRFDQPIYKHELWVQLQQARLQADESREQVIAEEQNLMIKTSERYFNVLLAEANLSFAKAELEALSKQLEDANTKFELGAIAITDTHEAKARYDLQFAETIEAKNTLSNNIEALKEITGQYLTTLNPISHQITPEMHPPETIEDWSQLALHQNPNILAAVHNKQRAEKEITRRFTGHLPDVQFVASASYTATGGRFGDFKSKDESVRIELDFPIFESGRVVFQTQEARHLYEQATQNLESLQRQVTTETRQNYSNLVASISRITAFKQALVSNQASLDATQAGYDVGSRNIIDVLNAQSELFQAKSNFEQARYDYALNYLKLRQSAGTLSEDDITEVNGWLVVNAETPKNKAQPYG